MNRKEEVGEVEESGEGWILEKGTEKGTWCEVFGGGGWGRGGGLRWEVSGGNRAVREKRWPLGQRPRPKGRAGPGVWVGGRSLVEGQNER